MLSKSLSVLAATLAVASAQTYQRLGTCPKLGCILPPDQQDFLPGQFFDLRLEVHAPVNGTQAFNNGRPDGNFTVTITKEGNTKPQPITTFFKTNETKLESWSFSWYEDLFAEDAGRKSIVNVASKIYRKIALYEPGRYVVTLQYYGNQTTTAEWIVRPLAQRRKAKNVILFIGDGMTTNMITAARLIGHKSINGKYQSLLAMDQFPVLGHQMTHSIDSFMTDSANSASALYTGHKSTVNALGVYADSSPDTFDDPKVETIVELFMRVSQGVWGAVSTAFMADATPIALAAHSRSRYDYAALVDQTINGVSNGTWYNSGYGPEVWLGGGAEQFLPGPGSYQGKNYYDVWAKKGYQVALNKTSLAAASSKNKLLGIFSQSTLPVWLDRNVYKENLKKFKNDPRGGNSSATDLPGLKEMTLKAIDVLVDRSRAKSRKTGFFLMSEGASIDKQMHALDYDRALGDLLELDDTIRATISKLRDIGILHETQIIVTADHGHGFDVFGNADTQYLVAQKDDRAKRRAIGLYQNSGLSQYTVPAPGVSYGTGPNFPVNWDPRYTLAQGVGAFPDHRENYKVNKDGPRTPAATLPGRGKNDYYANPTDDVDGFVINGTLPVVDNNGVHSLTDVAVFAQGPCEHLFGGVYGNIDIFYKMAQCLGLGRPNDPSAHRPKPKHPEQYSHGQPDDEDCDI